MLFVVVYDRASGKTLVLDEFGLEDRDKAVHERFRQELAFRERSDVEVVLLGAPSREVLERTHGRYFNTTEELGGKLPSLLR